MFRIIPILVQKGQQELKTLLSSRLVWAAGKILLNHRRLIKGTVCLSLFLLPPLARAQANEISMGCGNGTYVQWSENSSQMALQLACQIGSGNDQLIIVPTNSPLDTSQPWTANVNDKDALWLFDIGSDGSVNLIIDFHDEAGVLTASLFDDRDGDGVVQFDVENGRILIRESPYWSMRVQAPEGWWQKGDLINHNLEIQVDAPIKAAFGSEIYLDQIQNDGRIDFDIKVIDLDVDGRPDQQLIQANPPLRGTDGIFRSLIMVNPEDDEVPLAAPFLWPLLGDGTAPDLVKQYGETQAPIQINWQTGQIRLLMEFVASRGNEGNWFIYAIDRLQPDKEQVANFEAPFAFYDLASDNDGVPELQIRYEHYPAGDKFMANPLLRPLPTANQNVRYSWDQDNDGQWDYKIDTIGHYEAADLITIDDLDFYSFDTVNLPHTVINSVWEGMTFVATEATYRSTEGIYEWPADQIRNQWLIGQTAVPPAYLSLPVGMRGEYRQQSSGTPQLYISAIDHKLHLRHAEGGWWQVSPTEAILYRNDLEDGMINQWQRLQNGTITDQLVLSGSYALVAAENSVVVHKIEPPLPLWQGAPPTNTADWSTLQANLGPVTPYPTFSTLTAQFDNPVAKIDDISVEQIRPLPNGFQLVAEVGNGFSSTGSEDIAPGQYRIIFDGSWQVLPLDSLWQLEVQVGQTFLSKNAATPIQLSVHKFSDQPDDTAYWLVGAADTTEILRQPVSQTENLLFNYQPTGEAISTLTFWIESEAGDVMARTETAISVQPNDTDQAFKLYPTNMGTAVLLGVMLFLFSGGLAWSARLSLGYSKSQINKTA